MNASCFSPGSRLTFLIPAVLITASSLCFAIEWHPGTPADPVIQALTEYLQPDGTGSQPVYIRCEPVEGSEGWHIARIDTEMDWWGELMIFSVSDGTVIDVAFHSDADPDRIMGQSISSIGSTVHANADGSLVYAVDRTHQGNGFLYLFRLSGGSQLDLICRGRLTLNIDSDHYDLSWSLVDFDSDGYEDLVLEGDLSRVSDVDLSEPEAVTPVRKVFIYYPDGDRFRLDRNLSSGIGTWDFLDSGYSEKYSCEE